MQQGKRVLAATVAAVLAFGLAACAMPAEEDASGKPATSNSKDKNATSDKPVEKMTVSQENALRSAESYLEMSGFSEAGLIDQLSSKSGEGYPKADAVWAVKHLDVDWNKQAIRAAKSYLEMSGFSRSGLIDQLSSEYGEQFTKAQATYAANQVGL